MRLLLKNESVISVDNFSNSTLDERLMSHTSYKVLNIDVSHRDGLLSLQKMLEVLEDEVKIWHLAANSDISKSGQDPYVDYENTLGTTISAITLAKNLSASEFIFASSSAIYGNRTELPMQEEMEIVQPVSFYGITKLASEMFISKFLSKITSKVRIYRFPNVIGLPMTHGVFRDFYQKLRVQPESLQVLGDGKQKKPFLHVEDLIDAMFILNQSQSSFEIYNIGPNDKGIEISEIAKMMVKEFSPNTKILFGNSPFGWEGDVPKYSFDLTKSIAAGLNPLLSSESSVLKFLKELQSND